MRAVIPLSLVPFLARFRYETRDPRLPRANASRQRHGVLSDSSIERIRVVPASIPQNNDKDLSWRVVRIRAPPASRQQTYENAFRNNSRARQLILSVTNNNEQSSCDLSQV